MKKLSYVSVVLLFMIMAACSGDDDFVVSSSSIYGEWNAKEVNIDGTWIDSKKANRSFYITLTEDGYWMSQGKPYVYLIKGDVVECYDEKQTTIERIIRFTALEGNLATAIVSWPASGKSIEVRMERDPSPYYCKAPYSYLNGVWKIINSDNGGTVTFNYPLVEIKDGDFSLQAEFGRYPIWGSQNIIYKNGGVYWEKRSPYFFVEPRDNDEYIDSISIRGNSSYSQYSSMQFVCVKK